ncbi:MAG: LysM peptidoglycan-binding domain-containing protein [Anaerolineae bacterium]|nr:LysM peptidoglycan-binding domain-containing protein [Anaerolineae bacterium]
MFKRKITALLALAFLIINSVGVWQSAGAQGQELLQNPSFETHYTAGNGQIVPTGWTLVASVPVGSSGHTWPGESRTGASWKINNNKAVFTAVGYQFVPGIRAGTRLRFSAWGNVYTCDRDDSCIDGSKGYRISMQESQSRTRIGVDPKGGTDYNAATVQWTPYISPFDHFEQMTIDFTSANDNGVTVFLFATQTTGMFLNHVYWDDASLQAISGSAPAASSSGGGVAVAAPTQAPLVAPAVRTQPPQADGSIVHTVQAGDTLSSIAVAYKVTVQQIRELNNLSPDFRFLQIGQKLIIKPADQPAGSGAASAETQSADSSGGTPAFGALITPSPTAVLPIQNTFSPNAAAITEQPGVATTQPTPVALQPTATIPTVAPISKEGSLCITAFDDANINRWKDADEKLLAGMQLKLTQGSQASQTATTGADNPSCFNNLTAGNYTIAAVPPADYGLTTAGQFEIEIKPGVPLALSFGAAKGYQPTPVGSLIKNELPPPSLSAQPGKTGGMLDVVFNNMGLIVIGVAGLIVVAGIGLALVMRRR